MNMILLDTMVFVLNETNFYEHIRIEKGSQRAAPIENILSQAKKIPKPKALYKVVTPEILDEHQFKIENVRFKSKEVVLKLKKHDFVVLNIVTSGLEIEEYCMDKESILEQYITMELCNYACQFARESMENDIKRRYGKSLSDFVYPGEEGFSIDSGKDILKLFHAAEEKMGVSFSKVGLPTPSRTAYSIAFG